MPSPRGVFLSSPDQVEDYVAQAIRATRKEQPKGDGGSVLARVAVFKSAEDSARRRLLYSEGPSLYRRSRTCWAECGPP